MTRNNSQIGSIHGVAPESVTTAQDMLNLDNTNINTNNEQDDDESSKNYSDDESELEDLDTEEEAAQLSALEVFMVRQSAYGQGCKLERKGFPSVADFLVHKQREITGSAKSTVVDENMAVGTEREHSPSENSVLAEQLTHSLGSIDASIDNKTENRVEVLTPEVTTPQSAEVTKPDWKSVNEMLGGLHSGQRPTDSTKETALDKKLETWKNIGKLKQVKAVLTTKCKDKTLDVVFHAHLIAII
ncbi:hypothetical protein BDQ17DRAFT_1434017 [Cyathus striatus]|nr:hypothetical protein BDQ17DRAFT_1434017 [Cyathus striatus]